ncbi:hypothetical protein MHZ92_14235 [Sporosarcina sp. ACRSL]|uniref:hypothetical protein n=1 Tax=Sporosarcina sp. ACRSL TaxID=2918215 RepID=UPI001EF6995A|nr:hypothetical protein [Sporosarcina sp. ACRSL]MCG7345294.1 hypothetical protein [Sporosarcina sp. ACRSL]
MALIPEESLPYFENQLYLPLVLTILSRDRATIERGSFKLKAPYLRLIDAAIEAVQRDIKETADYLRANKLRLERGAVGDTFTTYIFYYGGYTEERRYLNVRLRNRTEELLEIYLMRGSI